MPDFSRQAVHQFWQDYNDPYIYRVVSFMESVEHWTYDGNPDVETALQNLGNAFENTTKFELKKEEHYIKSTSNLYITRLLRVLQALDSTHPGTASKVLMYSEQNAANNRTIEFYLRRNIAFERLRLLARVFSPERLKLLTKTLEGDDND